MGWFLELERGGEHIPELDDQPELFKDLIPYWTAFRELTSSRRPGSMSAGYIPRSEITNYLNEEQIFDSEDRIDYIRWVQFIDSEYISFQETKKKENGSKKPRKK